jgi:hypothetical protein
MEPGRPTAGPSRVHIVAGLGPGFLVEIDAITVV